MGFADFMGLYAAGIVLALMAARVLLARRPGCAVAAS